MTRRRRRHRGPRDAKLKTSQVGVFVPACGPSEIRLGINARMFVEDVTNGLMPYRSRSEDANVRLLPENDTLEQLITEAFSIGHGGDELNFTISEFVRLCGSEILHETRAIFEIIYFYDAQDLAVDFTLLHLNPDTVRELNGRLIQVIPDTLANQWKRPTQTTLPSDRLVVFQAPSEFRAHIPKVMGDLVAVDDLPSPKWAMDQMTGQSKVSIPYDFAQHQATRDQFLAFATKRFGWNMRSHHPDRYTEHYFFQRHLRFEEFRIRLRNEILKGINEAISMAGGRIGFDASIEFAGVPTLEDVEGARYKLMLGEGSFDEISDPFLDPAHRSRKA